MRTPIEPPNFAALPVATPDATVRAIRALAALVKAEEEFMRDFGIEPADDDPVAQAVDEACAALEAAGYKIEEV